MLVTKESATLDKSKLETIQETLAFWIIWPAASKLAHWLPFGSLLGLYTNIWLVWPLVNTPNHGKVTGVRLILDDYLPQWMAFVEQKQLELVDLTLKLKNVPAVKFTVGMFGLEYVFDYLQAIKDSKKEAHEPWSVSGIGMSVSFLSSLFAPLLDFTAPESISMPEQDLQQSVDGFAIVTERDFRESVSSSSLSLPKGQSAQASALASGANAKATTGQVRKSSSSSFTSKFGLFS